MATQTANQRGGPLSSLPIPIPRPCSSLTRSSPAQRLRASLLRRTTTPPDPSPYSSPPPRHDGLREIDCQAAVKAANRLPCRSKFANCFMTKPSACLYVSRFVIVFDDHPSCVTCMVVMWRIKSANRLW